MEDVVARELLRPVTFPWLPSTRRGCRWDGPIRRVSGGGSRSYSRVAFDVTHLFSADDADLVLHRVHLLARGVRVSSVHVASRRTVLNKRADAAEEGAEGEVNVAEDVKWESLIDEDDW